MPNTAQGGLPSSDPRTHLLDEESIQIRLPDATNDHRNHALPIRPGDLMRLLKADPAMGPNEAIKLDRFGQLLGALFHSEMYNKLKELKELYAPLDPDSDYIRIPDHTQDRTENCDERFLSPFVDCLTRANYHELDLKIIMQAITAANETGLNYEPDFGLFEHLRVFARGFTRVTRAARNLRTKFRRRTVVLDAYQRLVVVLKFKEGMNLGPYVRDDVVYLRMFKDVPHVDMEMHLPEQGTRVRMRWIDRAQIASPLVMGIPAMALKMLPLFASLAVSPYVLGGLMIGPISAGMKSFFGFQRAKQTHLAYMIRNLYYLTLANNASVLTRLIDSAEEEEYKETMLGYYFLWRSSIDDGENMGRDHLDRAIEQFLADQTGAEINFEISDSLDKLQRLGLVRRDLLGHFQAVPIDDALVLLDKIWDDTFRYHHQYKNAPHPPELNNI